MYVYTHPHCTYLSTSSCNLHHHMASHRVKLERQDTDEATVKSVVQTVNRVQQPSIEIPVIAIEPEPVLSYRFDDTKQSETISAVLDWTFSTMELFKRSAERYAKTIVELLHCKPFEMEEIRNNLNCVTSCSYLMRESSIQVLENQGFVKEKLITKQRETLVSFLCTGRG